MFLLSSRPSLWTFHRSSRLQQRVVESEVISSKCLLLPVLCRSHDFRARICNPDGAFRVIGLNLEAIGLGLGLEGCVGVALQLGRIGSLGMLEFDEDCAGGALERI